MEDAGRLETVLGLIDHALLKKGLVERVNISGSARATLGTVIRAGRYEIHINQRVHGDIRPREKYSLLELESIGLGVCVNVSGVMTAVQIQPDATSEYIFAAARDYLDAWETRDFREICTKGDSDALGVFELLIALYCRTGHLSVRKARFGWPSDTARVHRFVSILRPYGYHISIVDDGVHLDAVCDDHGRDMPILPPVKSTVVEAPPPDADFGWYW